MNSRRKRLDALLKTADRGGLCDISAHNSRCLYSKNVPEEDKPGVLEILRPDALAVHERFLGEEKAQTDEEIAVLAEIVAMDRMTNEGREEEDDYEDVETDRENCGVVLARDI